MYASETESDEYVKPTELQGKKTKIYIKDLNFYLKKGGR